MCSVTFLRINTLKRKSWIHQDAQFTSLMNFAGKTWASIKVRSACSWSRDLECKKLASGRAQLVSSRIFQSAPCSLILMRARDLAGVSLCWTQIKTRILNQIWRLLNLTHLTCTSGTSGRTTLCPRNLRTSTLWRKVLPEILLIPSSSKSPTNSMVVLKRLHIVKLSPCLAAIWKKTRKFSQWRTASTCASPTRISVTASDLWKMPAAKNWVEVPMWLATSLALHLKESCCTSVWRTGRISHYPSEHPIN